jgi:predicted NBD/HSP70 family sugar kinase
VCNEAVWQRYKPRIPFQSERFSELIAAADHGENRAREVLNETARYIALGAANITFALNPAEIVLAGKITEAWPLVKKVVEAEFSARRFKTSLRRSWFERETPLLYGAVHLAISKAFLKPKFGMRTIVV